jgi:hypothetical protein
MKNSTVQKTLTELKELSYENLSDKVKEYPINVLETLAVELYDEPGGKYASSLNVLEEILHERRRKLNNNFEWTPENRQRFLTVNDAIMRSFDKAYKEALSVSKYLEDRIKKNDSFIQDYEIDIIIRPYLNESYESYCEVEGWSISHVLSDPTSHFYPIQDSISHCHYDSILKEKSIFLDKSYNWNIEGLRSIFPDDYICYGMYRLKGTYIWSFKDILGIKMLWADVNVTHQHFDENI